MSSIGLRPLRQLNGGYIVYLPLQLYPTVTDSYIASAQTPLEVSTQSIITVSLRYD